MSAQIDVAGPIKVILRRAEREFDQKILELTPESERASLEVSQQYPIGYALGQMNAALAEGLANFARAIEQGSADYRNGVRRG